MMNGDIRFTKENLSTLSLYFRSTTKFFFSAKRNPVNFNALVSIFYVYEFPLSEIAKASILSRGTG